MYWFTSLLDFNGIFYLQAHEGEKLVLYVEMACTEMFGTGGWGGFGPRPAEEDKKYTLSIHQIAVFDRLAYELLEKFTIIKDIAKVWNISLNERNYFDWLLLTELFLIDLIFKSVKIYTQLQNKWTILT